ncbi:hypothetical protein CKO51_08700 [Rhodopirellula sp. SM50]|nr:hypothetical protein [Rhodopirellula sp. SM50]PAY19904.1 hypothetical protein CKO51_08700 [Rhodopirellula sp. SM50]
MSMLWRWFYRSVVAIAICILALALVVNIAPSRPLVTQSDGYIEPSTTAFENTISHKLPESATEFRFCRASVGIGGRLLLYRFTAPIDDLNAHAIAEFDAHWDRPGYKATPDVPSPFDEHDVKRNSEFYGGNADWMLPQAGAIGTLYEPADGQLSHRPTIFVDETNGVLYFQMTD